MPEGGKAQVVLVGVDGSDSSLTALTWAADFAGLSGSTLQVVITWEWPTSYGWAFAFPSDYDPTADARKVLDQALGPVRSAHPELTIVEEVTEGHPAKVLVDQSADADLLVVGSRGHGEFSGMLIGSVSEHCVSNARCPVVVVRERQNSRA